MCIFNTTVDDQPPTINCAADTNRAVDCGTANTQVNFQASAFDNCGAVTVRYSSTGSTQFTSQSQSSATMNVGTSTVTAVARDTNRRTATCETRVSITQVAGNPCANHNCQNGGQCEAFPGSCTQYSCQCPPCYYGRFCENRIDACFNHYCENGAICQAQPNSCTDYSCACPSCFTGLFCQTAVPDPCTNNPCVNGGQCSRVQGTCYAYQCSCQPGFEGANCEIRTQINVNPCNNFPCENGGSCAFLGNNYYACTCPSGYGGINCETPIDTTPNFESCNNVPCQNNGECYNGYDQNSATQGFYRNQYTCVCNRGFGGSNCLTSVVNNPAADECSGIICRNGGTCVNAYFSYAQRTAAVCNCNIGFFGQFCEISTENPCLSNPCRNGAQCTPFNTYFVCACTGQFSGITCEQGGGGFDTVPPVVICPQNQQATATQGTGGTVVTYPPATATDNSGGAVQLTYGNPSGTFFSLGQTVVAVTGRDTSGNIGQCTFTVTVSSGGRDTTPPNVNCPGDQQGQGQGTCTVNYPQATATDNSGGFVRLSYSFPSGSSFPNGQTTVTVTGTDPSGNRGFCTFTVTCSGGGFDTVPPVVICPQNQQATATQGAGGTVVTYPPATATDNSGGAVQLTYGNPSGTFFSLGQTVVAVTGRDTSGNIGQCTFTVTVSSGGGDTTPPNVNCPGDQQGQGQGTCTVNYPQATATDNSGGFVRLSYSFPSGSSFPNGPTAVTVTGTDPSGNRGFCTFTVTCTGGSFDTVPPVVICPQNQQATAAQGAGGTVVTYPPATATDNSGGAVQLTYGNPSGTFFSLGQTVVAVTGRDPSGNVGQCSFTVTVSSGSFDTVPPVVICPQNQQATAAQGAGGTVVTYPPATATDNSGGAVQLTYGNPSGTFFSLGQTVVAVTGRDPSGNVGQCSFTVTVSSGGGDTTPPNVNCPGDQQGQGQGTCTVNYPQATATDNSGGFVRLSYSFPSGSSFPNGPTAVTVTGTDPSGNRGFCTFTVTCTGGAGGTVVTYPPATATDNSGGAVQLTYGNPSGTFFSLGQTVVAVTGRDPSGNVGQCSFTVTVSSGGRDTTPPNVNCPGDQQGQGQGTCTVNYPQATATDNSGGFVRLSYNFPSGSSFPNGPTSVTVTGTDPSGNRGFCTFTVTCTGGTFDTVPPVVICPQNQQATAAQGAGGTVVTYPPATATDNSGGAVQLTYGNPSGTFFSLGQTVVAVTGRDPSGNVGQCSFTVTVSSGGGDTTPPNVNCPGDQQGQGQGTCTVNYPQATATDNSGGFVRLSYSFPSGSSFPNGPTSVTVTGTDPSGNRGFCTFIVTCTGGSFDTVPPVVICPQNQQATAAQGAGGTVVTYPPATATDNSGGAVQLTYGNPSGTFFSLGQTVVAVTGRDPSGNVGQCSFTVTVSSGGGDTTPPNVNCPGDHQGQGQGTCTVNYPQATATDNSGGFVRLSYSFPSGSSFPNGPTSVTVTGTDPSGNRGFCTFTVTCTGGSFDTVPPVVICPQNQQATAAQGAGGTVVTYPPATATDNSGGAVQLTYGNPSGTFFSLGQTVVAVTGRDPSGNVGQCSFTVTVSSGGGDTTPPNVNCPGDQQGQGQGTCTVNYPQATATDNSGGFVRLSYSFPSGSSFPNGPTSVTVTGTDPSGNRGFCTFTVTCTGGSFDTVPPVVICPQNQQATVAQGIGGTVVTYPPATATDNSGGAVQLIYGTPSGTFFRLGQTVVEVTGRDTSGNIGQCSFTVTVLSGGTPGDIQAPWPVCPDNQVATTFQGQSGTTVTYPAATATGNSDQNVQLSYSNPSGSFFDVGTTVVTVTATDPSGNSVQCIFAVTVNFVGQNAPFVSGCNAASNQLQVDEFVTLGAGQNTAQVTWNVPTASGAAVRAHNSLNSGSQFPAGLTEIIYIFGNEGNEATCTFRVYVLRTNEHSCSSNPCPMLGETCFFSTTTYLCQQAGRKRRDIEEELDCGPYCKALRGICASHNHFGEPYEETQCFYPGYQPPDIPTDPCDAQPCMNNGTCAPIYDLESTTRYFCFCPPGLEGKHCELKSYVPYDNGAVDYIQEDGSMMLGYWFIYILLGVICLVVLFQSIVVCKLVAKQMRGIPSGYKHMDDKVVYY
ncbi:hyalin-like [Amphiura filiformis]|uniref:hyalin-like n=1 Tax=Amphiura filiformis TaxID=82378 RepID=UPI003B223E88